MTHALLATDHIFSVKGNRVYDSYCFGSEFFEDYLKVFDTLTVVCRARPVSLVDGLVSCDLDRLSFHSLPVMRGIRWALYGAHRVRPVVEPLVRAADCVIVRVPSRVGFEAARLARKRGIPVMAEVIGDPALSALSTGPRRLMQLFCNLSAKHLKETVLHAAVVSYVSVEHLQRRYPARQGTVTSSVSSIRLSSRSIRPPRVFAVPPRPLKVICVASLVPVKRHKDLVQACALTAQQGTDLRVTLVGDGPCRHQLETQCRALAIEHLVTFKGHIVGWNRLTEELDAHDVFALCSSTEGMPRSMIEGMARGLPAVGSRVGGIAELIRCEDSYDAGDVHRLAQLLGTLARSPERLTLMSNHSHLKAEAYAQERLSPIRCDLYRHLAAASKSAPRVT